MTPVSTRSLQSVCSRVAGTVAPTVVSTVTSSTLELELSLESSTKYSLNSYPFASHVWSVAKSIRGSSTLRSLFSSIFHRDLLLLILFHQNPFVSLHLLPLWYLTLDRWPQVEPLAYLSF